MKKTVKPVDVVTSKPVLTDSNAVENISPSKPANPGPAWGSPTPNNGSLPKSVENNTENAQHEKSTELPYDKRVEKCFHDLKTQTSTALKMLYPAEYKTWSNSKNRSKKLKGITGPHWGTELDTFPGFLGHACPKPTSDHSLDRIDPKCGYVIGNIRWASKQLQSENRQNVEMIMVRGVPMTKHQLADFLDITYDALRMRLHRGDTAESILASHLPTEKQAAKSLAAKTEACPWLPGKEEQWERAFEAERGHLLPEEDRDSRTAFFVAKCSQKFREVNEWGRDFADRNGPDEPMPLKWRKAHEYWKHALEYAHAQRELAFPQKQPKPYSVLPSEEELEAMEMFTGPPDVTDDVNGGQEPRFSGFLNAVLDCGC